MGYRPQHWATVCRYFSLWRVKHGQSVEQALRHSKKQIRVQGQTFPSVQAAAAHFGVSGPTARYRIRNGWSLEKALTAPLSPNSSPGSHGNQVTVKGVSYPTFSAACEAHGVHDSLAYWRLRRGWEMEAAVTTPKADRSRSFRGKTYPSLPALCRAYGLDRSVVQYRMEKGWSLEKALTTEKTKPTKSAKISGRTNNPTKSRRQ